MTGPSRTELVRQLVEYHRPPNEVLGDLAPFGWDSDHELAQVGVRDVHRMLEAFTNSEIEPQHLEKWANAIECRDDVGFASEALKEVIHELANPLLYGPLDTQRAAELRTGLI